MDAVRRFSGVRIVEGRGILERGSFGGRGWDVREVIEGDAGSEMGEDGMEGGWKGGTERRKDGKEGFLYNQFTIILPMYEIADNKLVVTVAPQNGKEGGWKEVGGRWSWWRH